MVNKKDFIIDVIYYALIFAIVYLFCNYLLRTVAPFIIGFVFAYIALKISRKLFKKDTKLFRILSLIILYILVIGIIVLLIVLGVNKLTDFFATLPNIYKNYVEPALNNLNISIDGGKVNLPVEIEEQLKQLINNLSQSIRDIVSSFSSYLVSAGTNIISNTTSALIAIIVMIISSFFFLLDYDQIFEYLYSVLSDNGKKVYDEVSNFMVNTVLLIIKSYALIMTLTFVELFIGFLIMGIENFGMLAIVIAFLDILPILGVGTVLIPWSIIQLILGNSFMGIGLAVIYVIITFIRNIVEPKIVGGSLGLHPIVTLLAMLVGIKLFGAIGMFGLPLVVSFFVKRKGSNIETSSVK